MKKRPKTGVEAKKSEGNTGKRRGSRKMGFLIELGEPKKTIWMED